MIQVTLLRSEDRLQGFTCFGHAGHGEAGTDIVCSAVSALTQTIAHSLTEIAKLPAGVSVDEDGGIHCVLAKDATQAQLEKADLLLRTLELGLSAIDKAYPKTLKIKYREV